MDEVEPTPSPAQSPGPSDRFSCEVRSGGHSAAWVCPRGELDRASVPRMQRELERSLGEALLVIVDLRQLTSIDDAGVQLLSQADDFARQSGRRLVLVRNPDIATRLTGLAELDGLARVLDLS